MADPELSNTRGTRAPRRISRAEVAAVRPAPKRRSQKPVLIGDWQPTLPSRMNVRSKGCGHYTWGDPHMTGRIAAFDLDGTVIQPGDGKAFPKDSFDWQFCSPLVVPKLRELHRAGYSLVLISNQASSNPKLPTDFRKKVPYICRKIGVPLHVYACWDFDEYRKPAPGMWHAVQKLVAAAGNEIDYDSSFYVGDAAGRRTDHADTDRKFALNAGLRFMTPEELFAGADPDPDWALWGWNPFSYQHAVDAAGLFSKGSAAPDPSEVVLLVGAPASGKTHHYEHALQPQGYQLLEFGTERGFAVPLHVKGWLQQRLDVPVPTSGSEEAPFSPGPPPSGAPARLVLSSSFPSRHSRRNLLAYLRTTYPHARLGAIVFSPAGGFDEAASGKGGVELWKHNSVWRMAYQTRSGEEALNRNDSLGRAGPTSLVPIEAFKRWERDWEEPTLDEGFDAIEQCVFGLDPARTSPHAFAAWHQWLADVYPGKAIKTGRVAIEGPGWTGIRSAQR
ncbi:PNK3P-domain-containing protein [Rhodotorula sp. JG-1b]|nr:PNK3P-domain-containing protein [Rhodotorula sp. JG-1b]